MGKKYFFFDIDGTLTDRATGKVVPSALVALQKLQEEGHFVAIATGRAHYKAVDLLVKLGLHNMVCCGGGGLVVNDELVKNVPLNNDLVLKLIDQCEENGVGWFVTLNDTIEVYSRNDLFIQQAGERREPTTYIIDENFKVKEQKYILKAYVSASKEQEKLLPALAEIGFLRFEGPYLIVQHDAKDMGILNMMEYLHADIKDVVVFGDDTNDLVMFDPRWFSIAVGNACEQLKAKADYVTDKNVDDGIYHACVKFGWIEE